MIMKKMIILMMLLKIQNLFYRFMVSVAARTGNMLDYSSISKDIGVSLETIRKV